MSADVGGRHEALLSEGQPAGAETRPGCVTPAAATPTPTADRDAGGGGLLRGPAQPHERASRRSSGRDYAVTVEMHRALLDDPRWQRLSHAHRLLLSVAVLEWADIEGRWWVKRRTWAERASVKTTTVDAALVAFRRLGLIDAERSFRASRSGAPGGQSSNTYRLDPALVQRASEAVANRRRRPGSPLRGEAYTVPPSGGRPGSPLRGEPEGKQLEEGVLEGSSSTKERRPRDARPLEETEDTTFNGRQSIPLWRDLPY